MEPFDFEALGRDVLKVFEQHGLQVDNFGLSITLTGEFFDARFAQHAEVIHGRMVGVNVSVDGKQGSIQFLRRRDVNPDMIMRPPE